MKDTLATAREALQETNYERGYEHVERLRGVVVSLMAELGPARELRESVRRFVEYNRSDPDFTNLAYAADVAEKVARL